MRKLSVLFVAVASIVVGSWSNAAKPADYGLKEGDLISAIFSDDPDVYIINENGYKRLFLNPEIFNFYGHLGGFAKVSLVTPEVRDAFTTSTLFRDCEANDPKVYGVEVKTEDMGNLRWVNVSGDQAVKDDPDFFKKVFCINKKEFDWYPKGESFKSVSDVPKYSRGGIAVISAIPATPAVPASPSQPLTPPDKTASPSFSPTPSPATPATPAQPAQPQTTYTPTPSPTPIPTPTPTPIVSATPTPTPTPTPEATPSSLISDNLNSYQDGFLWNQGGWTDVVNGESFIVQSDSVNEGAKAVQNNYHDGPAIITKLGSSLSSGRQSLYFKTNNRAGWTANSDGNIQIRITKGSFHPSLGNPYSGSLSMNSPSYHPPFFIAVTIRKDGNVTYYDPSLMAFKNFDTYNDNEWTHLEVEWRSSNGIARYRVNAGVWTAWLPFYGSSVFSSFDSINLIIDNRIYYGSGGVYFDYLQ